MAQAPGSGKSVVYVECRERNKAHPELETWTLKASCVVDSLERVPFCTDSVNRYGSLATGDRYAATGYFRTVKLGDRWMTVDPDGLLHVDAVVVSVTVPPYASRESMDTYRRLFTGKEEWMDKTAELLFSHGFNGMGNWSDVESIRSFNSRSSGRILTYCPNLNVMASYAGARGLTRQLAGNLGYPNQCIPVFDPMFPVWCDSLVAVSAAKYGDDAALMGYFSDNELPFGKGSLEGYLSLPEDDFGHIAAQQWLDERSLGTEDITDSIRCAFAGAVAERYYSTVGASVRKHDPAHMYLGSRLHGSAKYIREVYQAAGRHCDVISMNYYGSWAVTSRDLERWENWADKPFIITEFYTKAEDSGLSNQSGAGWIVRTQEDRGIFYENFVLKLLESRCCVGWHWFRYMDNDPGGRGADPSNSDANKGIVNIHFKPYEDLLKHMKRVNEVRYQLIEYK